MKAVHSILIIAVAYSMYPAGLLRDLATVSQYSMTPLGFEGQQQDGSAKLLLLQDCCFTSISSRSLHVATHEDDIISHWPAQR